MKLNLGCGALRPDGWINADSSLNASLQKIPLVGKKIARVFNPVVYSNHNCVYMNLNRRWKYRSDSVDVVYASHLFEHLSLKSASLFLSEAYRCLKPDGTIRIVVPDLYKIAKKYVQGFESDGSVFESTQFIMWAINMHREGQYGSAGLFKRLFLEFQGYPHQHKFMYDEKTLQLRLQEHGFRDCLSLSYSESVYIPEIRDVEGASESYLSVYLEAKKAN